MKHLLFCLLGIGIIACQQASTDTIAPEYDNWYVLRSPIDRPIISVWGDIDKTLLISTTFSIFRSTDRGRNWQPVKEQSSGPLAVTAYRDTLFITSTMAGGTLVNATYFSLDDGQTWAAYRRFNPKFELNLVVSGRVPGISIDPVTATDGATYKIRQYFYRDTTKTVGVFETPGVTANASRRINLPQLHQLQALHLDSKERLYIVGSDAVCDGRKNFHFCNSSGGRGVVYVSKKPLP
ncbi:hypothetical protein [Fibrella aquatilis]|uniref:Exo-alpha-sialidase n=1 Tax=Fibrella aquatilis TaxID=2817059 RepID=A0A939GAN5_9BACT|nr:hypothetical protein [Fibrella aquatilis]MBO0933152.1 hypothetical protein [Fibrella aquatilis]